MTSSAWRATKGGVTLSDGFVFFITPPIVASPSTASLLFGSGYAGLRTDAPYHNEHHCSMRVALLNCLQRWQPCQYVLILLLGLCGCMTKSKAKADARAAYMA